MKETIGMGVRAWREQMRNFMLSRALAAQSAALERGLTFCPECGFRYGGGPCAPDCRLDFRPAALEWVPRGWDNPTGRIGDFAEMGTAAPVRYRAVLERCRDIRGLPLVSLQSGKHLRAVVAAADAFLDELWRVFGPGGCALPTAFAALSEPMERLIAALDPWALPRLKKALLAAHICIDDEPAEAALLRRLSAGEFTTLLVEVLAIVGGTLGYHWTLRFERVEPSSLGDTLQLGLPFDTPDSPDNRTEPRLSDVSEEALCQC